MTQITEADVLAAFGLKAVDLASLQPMKVAEDAAKAEREHFENVIIPKRMDEIEAELTAVIEADSTILLMFDKLKLGDEDA